MWDIVWNEYENLEPRLDPNQAEKILRNVYKAAGVTPPENCAEIIRRGGKRKRFHLHG